MSKMKSHPIKMPDSLWNAAVKKSGMVPVAAVVRKLIDMWIKDEITIDSQGVQNEEEKQHE